MTKGDTIGELTLLHSVVVGVSGRRVWTCRCSCGKMKTVRQDALKGGLTRSCGHLQREYAKSGDAHRKHGMSETPIWHTWKAMLRRCYEVAHKDYANYGGRGIHVCASWHRFENFLSDMGEKPDRSYLLERRDNNRGYSKDNCYWATRLEQNRNTRANHIIDIGGKQMCLSAAAETYNINYGTLKSRLRRGATVQEAIQ